MNDQIIGNHIQHLFATNGKISLLLLQQAVELWAEPVGEYIAKQTSKIYAKQGIIYVSIPNAALRFEILNSRSQIIANINQRLGGEVIKGIVVL
jgi:hypothetical protein